MAAIIEKKVNGVKFMVEKFNGANEVVEVSRNRKITDRRFGEEYKREEIDPDFTGVQSFDEALELMQTGYQPTVEKLKDIKVDLQGQGKRVSFFNDIVGFAPVVPLAMMGVPTAMINTRMTPMKAKVVNIYYDMTASFSTDKEDIIKAGQKLLGAIMELEMQGYKFNLYAVQSYAEEEDADILCVKIKDANMPMDLKRMSFPLTHTAFFRCIGFDWYSRTPKGTYRWGFGKGLSFTKHNLDELTEMFSELFNEKAVYLSCVKIMKQDTEHLKEVLTSGK